MEAGAIQTHEWRIIVGNHCGCDHFINNLLSGKFDGSRNMPAKKEKLALYGRAIPVLKIDTCKK
jgi:hypothetical protein